MGYVLRGVLGEVNLGLLWCGFLSQVVAGGFWAGTRVWATLVRGVRQDSPKDSKSPLTKFALVNYYQLCLAGTGLVGWLSDVWNFHSGTSLLPVFCTWKRAARSRKEVYKGHSVHGQEFGPGCWSTGLFDISNCRSVLWNQEWEESFPLVCRPLQREGLDSFTQSRPQNGLFREDQNNNRRWEWEEQNWTKVVFSHFHLAPLPALNAQPKH